MRSFIERAPSHAQVVAGGVRQGSRGYYIEPTVVADLRLVAAADPR